MDDFEGNVWGDVPTSPHSQPRTSLTGSTSSNANHKKFHDSRDMIVPQPSRPGEIDFAAFDDHDTTSSAAVFGGDIATTSSFAIEPSTSTFTQPLNHDDLDDAFGDDDGFGPPATAPQGGFGDDDDDFGDFGDFDNAVVAEPFDDMNDGFDDLPNNDPSSAFTSAPQTLPPEPGPSNWRPLTIDPNNLPPRLELIEEVGDLLDPVFLGENFDPSSVLTDEPIRQVEGPGQILTEASSRSFHSLMFDPQNAPSMRAPNWTRSRIRRQYLISLGIPVNLDEVLPAQPPSKAMPVMQISTRDLGSSRPMSAPPGARNMANGRSPLGGGGPGTGARNSRAGTPTRTPQRSPDRGSSAHGISPGGVASPRTAKLAANAAQMTSLALGPKPELDKERINTALALTPERLTLLAPSTLSAHLSSLQGLISSTSDLLTHLLQEREALQQDSEAYNTLIGELVSEAQKLKMGGSGGSRRSVSSAKRGTM